MSARSDTGPSNPLLEISGGGSPVAPGSNPLLRTARVFLGVVLAFFIAVACWRPEYLNDPQAPAWHNFATNLGFGILLSALLLSSWQLPGRRALYLLAKSALCFLLVLATTWPAALPPVGRSIGAMILFLVFWWIFPRSADFWDWVRPLKELVSKTGEHLEP